MTQAPPPPPPIPVDEALATIVDAMAPLLGLHLDPAWRDPVVMNLRTLAGAARFLSEAPLEDELEPAPVFRA